MPVTPLVVVGDPTLGHPALAALLSVPLPLPLSHARDTFRVEQVQRLGTRSPKRMVNF